MCMLSMRVKLKLEVIWGHINDYCVERYCTDMHYSLSGYRTSLLAKLPLDRDAGTIKEQEGQTPVKGHFY